MNYSKLAEEIHQNSRDKGFWDKERNKGEMLMLIISELSEALEADRKSRYYPKEGESLADVIFRLRKQGVNEQDLFKRAFEVSVKDTFEDEIADAAIRILDTLKDVCKDGEIENLMSDIKFCTIPHNIGEALISICSSICSAYELDLYNLHLSIALSKIELLCKTHDINLEWYIENKMKYNSTRDKMHGKKY